LTQSERRVNYCVTAKSKFFERAGRLAFVLFPSFLFLLSPRKMKEGKIKNEKCQTDFLLKQLTLRYRNLSVSAVKELMHPT
jgi:hypothetical protein